MAAEAASARAAPRRCGQLHAELTCSQPLFQISGSSKIGRLRASVYAIVSERRIPPAPPRRCKRTSLGSPSCRRAGLSRRNRPHAGQSPSHCGSARCDNSSSTIAPLDANGLSITGLLRFSSCGRTLARISATSSLLIRLEGAVLATRKRRRPPTNHKFLADPSKIARPGRAIYRV